MRASLGIGLCPWWKPHEKSLLFWYSSLGHRKNHKQCADVSFVRGKSVLFVSWITLVVQTRPEQLYSSVLTQCRMKGPGTWLRCGQPHIKPLSEPRRREKNPLKGVDWEFPVVTSEEGWGPMAEWEEESAKKQVPSREVMWSESPIHS